MSKGFITIATGEYFCQLAINMVKSYRYSAKNPYPFAVITDENGVETLKDYFDKIVLNNDESTGYSVKLNIGDLSPFDETIFIDADTLIVRDISDWWKAFENSGYDVAVWGWNCDINDKRAGKLISSTAQNKYNIKRYIGFNGGVYYFKNNEAAKKIFCRAKELMDSYIEDDQHLFNGKCGDEPVMAVSLIEHGIYGVEDPNKERMFCSPGMTRLKINLLAGKCSFQKYDYMVYPAVMHWGTSETRTNLKYSREVYILDQYLSNIPTVICYIKGYTKYLCEKIRSLVRKKRNK